MGYRHYMYKINKDLVNEIKGMTLSELKIKFYGKDNLDNYFDFTNIIPQQEIYEFGKLYYDDTANRIYSKGIPMFDSKEVMDELSDYLPYIVGKEGLIEAIAIYQEKIINYYESLLKDDEDGKSSDKQKHHIRDLLEEWKSKWIINLDEKNLLLTDSWQYEYNIFNLVACLKSIDFEKETILFYGW